MEGAELFKAFGLEGALKQINANPALGLSLTSVIAESGLSPSTLGVDAKGVGNLLFTIAGGVPENRAHRRGFLAGYVGSGKLRTSQQVAAAVDFVKRKGGDVELGVEEFEAACGVGVSFTPAQVEARAREVLAGAGEALVRDRYAFPVHTLLMAMKEGVWRWAEGKVVKDAFDAAVLELLGPKTAEDEKRIAEMKKAGGAAKPTPAAATAASAAAGAGATSSSSSAGAPPTGGSADGLPVRTADEVVTGAFAARDVQAARNSERLLEEHKRATGGRVRTRFPPEPNGFLHIGHAKSMNLNFEGAFRMLGVGEGRGETIFRYDDTNPDAESKEYIDNQAENVQWMGWRPVEVTHSSNYFSQLFDFANRLIRMGKAYVCHQTKADIEASREAARAKDGRDPESPWRNRPVEESLREFEAMRAGRFEEGKVSLRLKIDMTSPNPTLWDPVAYRIKYTPHPHTGSAWCIYPSYDYSHAIIDSLENIDYSLCTLEFEVRRDLYYWVLEQLDIWRPHVWEFARLNITHVQLSKRKILKLVNTGKVRGWDDPRIPTINGLRRRGYTAEAINAFCRDIGVSRNDNVIEFSKLEFHIRTHLDVIARRVFVVVHPLRMELTNVAPDFLAHVDAPNFPRDPTLGSRPLPITNVVYIESSDFREVDDPSFYGLAPGKTAGLRYAGYVRVTEVVKDEGGAVVGLKALYSHGREAGFLGEGVKASSVKGNLHWVSPATPGGSPLVVEVREYDHLFLGETPGETGDWESELNPLSERVYRGVGEAPLGTHGAVPPGSHYQFERVGFFVADRKDSTPELPVFNSTVALKESNDKKGKA